MKHPADETLALFAGGDLGRFARWRTARHVDSCQLCRSEVARCEEVRQQIEQLGELPELDWSRLAGEMKANIRLGIAAGECIRSGTVTRSRVALGIKPLVAAGCVAALLMAGIFLQHPKPRLKLQGIVLEAVQDGIAVRAGNQVLTLVNTGSADVTYTAEGQGSMQARYVDSETGQVTIHNVYVQ
jgi:hypothetical protein